MASSEEDRFDFKTIVAYLDAVEETGSASFRINIVPAGITESDLLKIAASIESFAADNYAEGDYEKALRSYTRKLKALGVWFSIAGPKARTSAGYTSAELLSGAYYDRGVVFQQLGQFEKAVDDYGCAVGLGNPWPWSVLLNRGLAYEELGRLDDAEAALLEARNLVEARRVPTESIPGLARALKRVSDQCELARHQATEVRESLGSQPDSARDEAASPAVVGAPEVSPPTVAAPINPAPGPSVGSRVVRVFVSSTFRDMGAERDELVKQVFPALRKLCESRGVAWGEVDLRWGITDEEKAEGQVLPICLAEIARSRPYFIGLLGERYGWVPDAIEPATIREEPWLAEHNGRSVTELEILHGVLNDPAMAGHSFFYLRDPANSQGKPAAQFQEVAGADEIASLGAPEAERRAAERRAKLAALKERIRSSGLPVHDNYPDPRALGEAVLADLTAVIERLYPPGSEPNPLARESAEHEAFARSRSGVYIDRPDYVSRLDAYAAGDGPAFVVLGESGSGKSALLANWVLRYRALHPDDLVLAHFVGASPASTDWAAMVRRIIAELSSRLGIQIEIPDEPHALRIAFANALHMAAAKGRVVLVLDALNQLEDREGALDLSWLPPTIPAGVRLVLSTLPGRPLTELQKRSYPTLAVAPLEPAERERLIVEYLASYTKALGPALRKRIAAAPQCANPLYLRALLDELRVWGEHETLGDRIGHYLAAESAHKLYELILERYEADYERDRPGLVRDAFSRLWAARRGLSETELLDLLGTDAGRLPRAYWSPLFLAADSSLTSRSGLLGFFHDDLRKAVEHRYLSTDRTRQAAHLCIADYFATRELGPRKIAELPEQLARGQAWQRLGELLMDLTFLEAATIADKFDVRSSWAKVEANSSLRLVDAYRPLLAAPAKHSADQVLVVARLLNDAGHPEEALYLHGHLVRSFRAIGDRAGLCASLGNQANILADRGELDRAMALHKEEEVLCLELGDEAGLARSLGNQANILKQRGVFDSARALLERQELICRQLGDRAGLSVSLNNRALIFKARGEFDGAMRCLEEAERISREIGDPTGEAAAIGNMANIAKARGNLDEALALHEKVGRICLDLGDLADLQVSLGNQANILASLGNPDGALPLYEEQERICRELGNLDGLQRSLGNRASLLAILGDRDGALPLFEEQERICRKLGNMDGLAISLGNRANILASRGELNDAMALHKEKERICREIGLPEGLAISLASQAGLLAQMGRRSEALPMAEEAYLLASQHGLARLAQQFQPLLYQLRQRG